MSRHLYLIRHGETDYNRMRIVQGRGVDTSLNDKGRLQAKAFHQAYKEVPFDSVITSTLIRTHQSVAPFIEAGLPWHQFAELDEIDWGIHEGKPSTKEMRESYRTIVNAWQAGDYKQQLPGGESAWEMGQRQQRFIDQLPSITGDNLLICSHGRAMRSLLCLLLDRPLSDMDQFPHANLTLYQLKQVQDKYQLVKAHDTAHLRDLPLSS